MIVEDIATDARWRDERELALAHGLRACWSVPVLDAAGAPMAAFAMYYRDVRRPTDADRQLIDRAGRVAGVAIGHVRAGAALRASEERYRMLATNIPEVAWLVDRTGRTIFVSPNIAAVTGYTADEVHAAGAAHWLAASTPTIGRWCGRRSRRCSATARASTWSTAPGARTAAGSGSTTAR